MGRASGAALLVLALAGSGAASASSGVEKRDLNDQAACLTKQLRALSGSESGRGGALRAHFECFPTTAKRFSQLFEGWGPLADRPERHFDVFFAARGSVSEREWSAKAVGVIAGGEWSAGTVERYAQLLRLAIASRPTAPLDAAADYGEADIESFWRVLFGSRDGFASDPGVCRGRGGHRACEVLYRIGG